MGSVVRGLLALKPDIFWCLFSNWWVDMAESCHDRVTSDCKYCKGLAVA